MCDKNKIDMNLPMYLVEKCAKCYNEKIVVTIDKDYKICIHIRYIDRLKKRKYLSNLEGRGETYKDACIDYIKNLMDKKYTIRYKLRFYATEKLRTIIRKSNFNELYNSE